MRILAELTAGLNEIKIDYPTKQNQYLKVINSPFKTKDIGLNIKELI